MAFDIAILKYGLGWSLLQKQLSVFILIPLASKRELRIFSSNLMGCQSEELRQVTAFCRDISEKSKPRRQHPPAVLPLKYSPNYSVND
ncbi:unnamed protein product [Clonostachys rosea f. rosea IK726]|uniref:Uncharacterized protein n=1 Tax=Clonostachys rosea f. rosea IK726 TaxID=1349383 RepID=A0ACA9UDD0_BIOOC|nr:unnamed protein product [Clonostachys rosea f. rosea IK726]